MVNDSILECDLALNHAKQYPNLQDECVKEHSTIQNANVSKKLVLKRILARRR